MSALLASHTMPSLEEIFGALLAPLAVSLAGLAVWVGSCDGVRSAAKLSWRRSLVAVAGGLALGLAALIVVALPAIQWLGGLVAPLIILLGSPAAVAIAHHAAKTIADQLNWYDCRACGIRFQSRIPTSYCNKCATEQDHTVMAQALADFDSRYRALP
jgi:hypothetical protein